MSPWGQPLNLRPAGCRARTVSRRQRCGGPMGEPPPQLRLRRGPWEKTVGGGGVMGWDQSRPAAMPSGEGGTVGSTGEPRGHAVSLSCMHKRGGRGAHIQEPHTVSSRPLTPNRHSNSHHHNQARTLGPNRSCRAAPVETTDASVRGRRLPLFLPPQSPVPSTQSGTARRRGGDPSPSTLAQLAPRRPLAARIPGSIPRASSQMPASTHPAPNTVCTPTRTASCTASLYRYSTTVLKYS